MTRIDAAHGLEVTGAPYEKTRSRTSQDAAGERV